MKKCTYPLCKILKQHVIDQLDTVLWKNDPTPILYMKK